MSVLKDDEFAIGSIPQKELFNRATKDETIIHMMSNPVLMREHKSFFSILEKNLQQLQHVIDSI